MTLRSTTAGPCGAGRRPAARAFHRLYRRRTCRTAGAGQGQGAAERRLPAAVWHVAAVRCHGVEAEARPGHAGHHAGAWHDHVCVMLNHAMHDVGMRHGPCITIAIPLPVMQGILPVHLASAFIA